MAEGGFFRVSEIVQMAIDEEHNGTIFYETLQKCATSPALRNLRQATRRRGAWPREGVHRNPRQPRRLRPTETYPGEYADYVNVLVSGRTYPEDQDAAKLAHDAGGNVQAIDAAIRFKKNTLLFLDEIRKLVPDRDQPTMGAGRGGAAATSSTSRRSAADLA